MLLFCAGGAWSATPADLLEAMGGITASRFYAAFGSKKRLFREGGERYSKTLGAPMVRSLAEAPTAQAGMEQLLRAVRLLQINVDGGGSRNGRSARLHAGAGGDEHFAGAQSAARRKISSRLDVQALASFIITVIDGLAIQARDGASRQTLQLAADCAMAAWDKVVSTV